MSVAGISTSLNILSGIRRLIQVSTARCPGIPTIDRHDRPRMSPVSSAKHARGSRARGPELNYVPALDGVRGIAVVAIMGYHGGVFLTGGGYYSLDTFFTLSGFLITTLIVSEWQQSGRIRLARFWARRARRLLPALLLLLLVVVGYVAIFSPPVTYPGLRGDAFSSLFYVANWHFIVEGSNYFARTGATSPLLHTWSLAVEEQFYLVWPIVVLLVLRTRLALRLLLFVSVVGALASALAMALLYSSADQNRVYYGTDTRAQSLLVGAALSVGLTLWANREAGPDDVTSSFAAWKARSSESRRVFTALGVAGVAATAALWILVNVDDAVAFRGGFLLAAASTACVLASVVVAPGSAVASLLALAPLRYLGRISYGMYLWHFPLFLWLNGSNTGLQGGPLFLLRFACTVVVATVSYYVVEQPIRQRRFLRTASKAMVAAPAAIVAVVVVVFAATSASVTAAPTTFRPPIRQAGPLYTGQPVKLLLVGDSTAATLGIGLSAYQRDYDIKMKNAGILGCGVTNGAEYELQGTVGQMESSCSGAAGAESWTQVWRSDLATFNPNVVMILAGRWEVVNRTYQGKWTNILQPRYAAYVQRQLRSAVELAGSRGAKVMLLTAPCYDTGEQPNGEPWPEDSPQRLAKYNSIVREVGATEPNTTVVNFEAMACPSGHYQTDIDGVDARYDGVHFTLGGGVVFESSLFPVVARLGREQVAH
jgi:peptidoglycan/LPS O-acetylase OafA/YrhL